MEGVKIHVVAGENQWQSENQSGIRHSFPGSVTENPWALMIFIWKTAPPAKVEPHSTVSNFHHIVPTISFQKICHLNKYHGHASRRVPLFLLLCLGQQPMFSLGLYYPEAKYNILFEKFTKENDDNLVIWVIFKSMGLEGGWYKKTYLLDGS